MRRLLLPSGTSPSTQEPPGDRRMLEPQPGHPATSDLVDQVKWWTSQASPAAVLSYLRTHPPAGGMLDGTGGEAGGGQPKLQFVRFSFPAVPGVLATRWLVVEVVPLKDGSTGIRADAEVVWIGVRSRSENVPAAVRVVDVVRRVPGHPPSVSETVTNRTQVGRIIGLIDQLPIVQPGVSAGCPGGSFDVDTFTFRATQHGRALAVASVSSDVGYTDTSCDAMSFSVRGRPEPGLVQARDFLQAVEKLLGVKLTKTDFATAY